MTVQNIEKPVLAPTEIIERPYFGLSKADLQQSLSVKKLLNLNGDETDKVLKQLGVSKVALNEMIRNVREWFEKQQHLPQGDLHDEVITRRLITQSFSIERVKEKIDNFYTTRHRMPEILRDRDPLAPTLNKCLRQGYWVVLPKRTPDNKRVTILRLRPVKDTIVTEVIKVAFMTGELRMWVDDMSGDHWVFDFKYSTLQHAMQFTPVLITKVMFYLNYCLGPKVVGMHLINLPPFALSILSLFKNSMKSKMVDRLYTYNSFEELFKVIPRNIFPRDLGGDEPLTCQDIADEWRELFETSPWKDYFIEQETVGSDESKRLAATKIDELFGVAGSFRKLELD